MKLTEQPPEFLTITILKWKRLLAPKKYKDLIVDSLKYFVETERAFVYAFCIMDNHIHIIWQARSDNTNRKNQHSFTKFVANKIKKDLKENHPEVLEHFWVSKGDRKYQF